MESFKTLQDTVSAALITTTRSATRISGTDIPFQRSLNPSAGTDLDVQNVRLLQLAQRLLENAAASSDAACPTLPDIEAIDGSWRGIVDIVDSLLEKADTNLDEYTGAVKRLSPSIEQPANTPQSRNLTASKHIEKPQLSFENPPKNYETGGFRPLITSKPHAKLPLEESLMTIEDSDGHEQYPHPYQTEIESYEYPPFVYQIEEPQPYLPFESTTATLVDTPEALAMMLAELKTAKEIAIDIEHHDNRSYIGLLSLMQISTRNKDWIVDTLKPWRRRLECLNEVFADPNILKVLHGAYMDIVWLQRDLGLYVVGLFDTYHAARALGYPQASLAFLLSKFANFQAQKQFQLADWRTRPLSDDMFKYARADTHFLLYVYDNMRNELIERSKIGNPDQDKVHDVLIKSKETALQRYEHPLYDSNLGLGSAGWYRLLTRTPVQFNPQQFSVFKAVHKWRDDFARTEDESPLFIMPNHAVFSIARHMPGDKPALFNVIQHVSHLLRPRADELVAVIAKAKVAGENGPDLTDTLKKIADLKFPEKVLAKTTETSVMVPAPVSVTEAAPSADQFEAPAVRTPSSRFWGALWSEMSEMSEQKRSLLALAVNLALPLPPLTAEIFAETNGVYAGQASPPVEKQEHVFLPKDQRPTEDQRTDIFIVKQLGGQKRKRTEATENLTETSAGHEEVPTTHDPDADEIMLEDDEIRQQKEEKARKKAEKKERKRQKALQQASGNGNSLDDDEAPAFDYANAPSVLRAQEVEAEQARSGKKKKDRKKKDQGFTPFSGMKDAPKGLPRTQKEGPGKSRTFKS